jgi:uncharacterized membrane protein (DUF441 family)/uncharacterized membrane protein
MRGALSVFLYLDRYLCKQYWEGAEMKNIRLTDKRVWLYLGVVSNVSAFEIFGNTIFIYVLYGAALLLLVSVKKVWICRTPYNKYLWVAIVSTILCLASSELAVGWKEKSIRALLNTLIALLIYYIMANTEEGAECYLKGIKGCCILQIVWGWGQVLLDKVLGIDLNFMLGFAYQHKEGEIVYNALVSHAGLLVPTMIIGFLVEKNLLSKLFFIGFAFLTRNTTVMIAMSCCVFLYVVMVSIPQYLCHLTRHKAKRVFLLMTIGMLCWIAAPESIKSRFMYSFTRVISLIDGKMTSGSDATHLRYLTSFPQIIAESSAINILFGFGLGTSGFQMIKRFNQYSNSIWTIECDWLDIFYSVGAIGFAIIYGALIYITIAGYRINKKYTVYALSMMIAGAFYNFHLYWVLLFEIVLFDSVKNKKDIWKIFC